MGAILDKISPVHVEIQDYIRDTFQDTSIKVELREIKLSNTEVPALYIVMKSKEFVPNESTIASITEQFEEIYVIPHIHTYVLETPKMLNDGYPREFQRDAAGYYITKFIGSLYKLPEISYLEYLPDDILNIIVSKLPVINRFIPYTVKDYPTSYRATFHAIAVLSKSKFFLKRVIQESHLYMAVHLDQLSRDLLEIDDEDLLNENRPTPEDIYRYITLETIYEMRYRAYEAVYSQTFVFRDYYNLDNPAVTRWIVQRISSYPIDNSTYALDKFKYIDLFEPLILSYSLYPNDYSQTFRDMTIKLLKGNSQVLQTVIKTSLEKIRSIIINFGTYQNFLVTFEISNEQAVKIIKDLIYHDNNILRSSYSILSICSLEPSNTEQYIKSYLKNQMLNPYLPIELLKIYSQIQRKSTFKRLLGEDDVRIYSLNYTFMHRVKLLYPLYFEPYMMSDLRDVNLMIKVYILLQSVEINLDALINEIRKMAANNDVRLDKIISIIASYDYSRYIETIYKNMTVIKRILSIIYNNVYKPGVIRLDVPYGEITSVFHSYGWKYIEDDY